MMTRPLCGCSGGGSVVGRGGVGKGACAGGDFYDAQVHLNRIYDRS